MRRVAATLFLWLWFCAWSFGASPVSLIIRQRLGMSPFYLVFTVQVEPHALNRTLCISWGNAGWEKNLWDRTCRQLEGLQSKRTYHYPVSTGRIIRESGTFIVEAEITRSDGKRFQDRTRIIIGGVPDDVGGFP